MLFLKKIPTDLVEDKFIFPAVVVGLCIIGCTIFSVAVVLVRVYCF